MSQKHDKKKMARRYGGDAQHVSRIVRKRQDELTEWIESMGGAEAVHRNHLSSIVAAKPRKRLTVTKPDNPYRGATIDYKDDNGRALYVITPPQRGGLTGVANAFNIGGKTDRELFNDAVPKMGGFKFKYLLRSDAKGTQYRTVYILPDSPRVGEFIRQLSVFWG